MEKGLGFYLKPWGVNPSHLQSIRDLLIGEFKDETPDSAKAGPGSVYPAASFQNYDVIDGTAHVFIDGLIQKRSSRLGTSVFATRSAVKRAIADPQVSRILLNVDSPGGSVDGIAELSDYIFSVRGKKPIIAYTDGQMLSAAYWIASAADKVYATKGSEVGSIGVYAAIYDISVLEHNAGIKTAIVKAGRFKAAGHPSQPMTEDDRKTIQNQINTYFDLFTRAVARNRKLTDDRLDSVANGKMFIGEAALRARLIDSVVDLDSIPGIRRSGSPAARASLRPAPAAREHLPSGKEMTLSDLKANFPGLVWRIQSEAAAREKAEREKDKAAKSVELNAAASAAVAGERRRVQAIYSAAYPGQERLAQELVLSGASELSARSRMDKAATDEQRARREWRTSPAVREEFRTEKSWLAYCRHKPVGA